MKNGIMQCCMGFFLTQFFVRIFLKAIAIYKESGLDDYGYAATIALIGFVVSYGVYKNEKK